MRDENAGISFVQEELTKFSFDRKYPYSVISQEELPEGVDPTRKEVCCFDIHIFMSCNDVYVKAKKHDDVILFK